MTEGLNLFIQPQPNDYTCGPTCLHAVYRYFGDNDDLGNLLHEVEMLADGGTLAVYLANHALKRGYRADIYSYNLMVFDPTWEKLDIPQLKEKLIRQSLIKKDEKLQVATRAYLEFFDLGGRLHLDDLTPSLVRSFLKRGIPIIAGLSATYLYHSPREFGQDYDDVRGETSGHFVVLCGYDAQKRSVRVADPLLPNPVAATNYYEVSMNRLVGAIFLGVLSYDAKLLIIRPDGAR